MLSLKVGKYYLDGRKQTWKVTNLTGNSLFTHFAVCIETGYTGTYSENGRFSTAYESENDFISELSEGDRLMMFFKEPQQEHWKDWWDSYDY